MKIKFFVASILIELLGLILLKQLIPFVPFAWLVFPSFTNIRIMTVSLGFISIRLLMFILLLCTSGLYWNIISLAIIRLGKKKAYFQTLVHSLISSAVLHLIPVFFCGKISLLPAVIQSFFPAVAFARNQSSSRNRNTILFIGYLIVCVLSDTFI